MELGLRRLGIENGLSGCHKLICTFLNSCCERFKSKIVYHRNYKKIDEANFPKDIKNCDFRLRSENRKKNYNFLTNSFINIVNKHVPLKKKFVRENQVSFMTRNNRKEIYTISRFMKSFYKNATKENEKQMC